MQSIHLTNKLSDGLCDNIQFVEDDVVESDGLVQLLIGVHGQRLE